MASTLRNCIPAARRTSFGSHMHDSQASGPLVCCGGIIVRGSRILLGKRSSTKNAFPNVWDVPGGRRAPGESLEETLTRELQEELGIRTLETKYIRRLDIADPSADLECHLFLVVDWEGVPSNLAPEEHDEIRWFTIDDACGLELACPEYPALFRQAAKQVEVLTT